MSVSMEDPNGRFEFVQPTGLDKYGAALGHFDKMLQALGVEKRTTDQFTAWLKTRQDIAKYTSLVDVDSALSPHEIISWATMPDGSAAGIVLSRRPDGNVLLVGSVTQPEDEKVDAQRIAAFGTKYQIEDVKSWLLQLEQSDD